MKKFLVIFLMLFSYLFAIDKASAIAAVKANPALLNTPQAQAMLAKEGMTKEQVLAKLNNKSEVQKTTSQIVTNNVTIPNKSDINKTIMTTKKMNTSISPLKFITEQDLVKKVQILQQKEQKQQLKRFGEKFFYNKNQLDSSMLAVPEYYQVNNGDMIEIQIFGGNDKTLNLTIDNNGNISLPILGPVYVAGMSVSELQSFIQRKLKPTYPNSKIVVNIKVNSFIQVTLSGFVAAPGIYNLNSLSTVKDLLIAANGFGKLGSMRNVYLKRGGKTIKIIDFYKLIKDGDIVDTTLLRNGDVIYVPKAKKLVSLSGAVNIPAIYELKDNDTLKQLIYFAGGITPDGSNKYIKITRFENNSYTKVLFENINSKDSLLNGDEIYVYKISELNKDLVYVYGNVEKPGTYEIPKDRKLKTLLKKLTYLKDTYYKYGLIETFSGKLKSFNINNPKNITLNYKDKVYIFNKYEILPAEFVTVEGSVVKNPGKYRYLNGMTLKDAINSAGLNMPFYEQKVQIISYTNNMTPVLHFVDFTKNPTYKLHSLDKITLFNYYDFNPIKQVTIGGEVNKPGDFNYTKNMTLKDLITSAGWITDKADTNYIELIRYNVKNNKRVREIKKLDFNNLNTILKPYDEVTIKRIPDWNERKVVKIDGEVKYPGNYTIKKGDTLYDLIKRAGGFNDSAYLYGAVFTRKSIQQMQEKRLQTMIYKLKKKIAIISASARGAGQASLDAKNLVEAIDSLAVQAEKLKPIGRVAITLDKNLEKFKKSKYNITLQDGDKLYIPTKPDSVVVLGEVLTPTAFVYTDNSALKYISQAGGITDMAENIYFVVHANGFTEKGDFGWLSDKDIKVKSGDAITVPIKIVTSTWYGIAKDVTSIVYQLAITAASLKTVGAL